jgi:cytoskeletal protein CcmA (bactofilin family)
MWNKREEEQPPRPASPAPAPVSSPVPSAEPRREHGAIGPTISIVGDLTGDEDLTILGSVQGKINIPQHSVTVGRSGRVAADIHAKVVNVEGEVRGNLAAGEQILIRKTATMLGNLTAPRVGLEDGCRFKGSVDMEMQPLEKARPARPAGTETAAKPAEPAKVPGGAGERGAPAKPDALLARS